MTNRIRIDVRFLFFPFFSFFFFGGGEGATRMACSYYSKSLPNSLAPRRDSRMCVWATVQTKVNRCISHRKRRKKRLGGKVGGRLRDEGGDVTVSVTVSCRLVLAPPPPFLQRPREIISSQYGVYQSSQNTRLPSGYMSRLSVCLSVYRLFLQ